MASHMKTTIDIPDALLSEAQAIAARGKTTLEELVNEGLRKVVSERNASKPFKLKDGSFGGGKTNTELGHLKWEDIVDKVYEGRGG